MGGRIGYMRIKSFRNKTKIYLLGIIILAVILRLIFFSSSLGSMCIGVAELASDFIKGTFNSFSGKFTALRMGSIYPTTISFWLFGINKFALAFYPLLCSIGSIIVTFYIGKILFNEKVGLLGALLLCFYPLDIQVGTCAYPDGPTAFFAALSVLLFIIGDKIQDFKKSILAFFLSGLSLGISYLCKLTGPLVILFYFAYILYNRKIKLRYLYTVLSFFILIFVENLFYYFHTNIWLYQLHTISSPPPASIIIPIQKLGYESYNLWIYPRSFFISFYPYGLYFYFFTIAAIYTLISKKRNFWIIFLWMITVFLYLQFGTTSLSHYDPLSCIPRYLSVISIPVVLLISAFLIEKQSWLKDTFSKVSIAFLILTSLFFSELNMLDFEDTRTVEVIHETLGNELNKPVYIDFRSARTLRFLYGYKKDKYIMPYSPTNALQPLNIQFDRLSDVYVVGEFNLMQHAKKRWFEIYPKEIFEPPTHWKTIKIISNPQRPTPYLELKFIKWCLKLPFIPKIISKKILQTTSEMGIEKDGIIYYIPKK